MQPSKGGSTLNLALIGQAVSEEKMFENGGRRRGRGRRRRQQQRRTPEHVYTIPLFEPRYEKTGFLHMRKQRRRSASR